MSKKIDKNTFDEFTESDILKNNPEIKDQYGRLYSELRSLEKCREDEYYKSPIDKGQIIYYENLIRDAHAATVEFGEKHGLIEEKIEKIREWFKRQPHNIQNKSNLKNFEKMTQRQKRIKDLRKISTEHLSNQDPKYLDWYKDFYIEAFMQSTDLSFCDRFARTQSDAKWRWFTSKVDKAMI